MREGNECNRERRSSISRLAASLPCLLYWLPAAYGDLPSAWRTGIATNYGGQQDGMDPWSPSFGTHEGACGYGLLDKTKFPYWSVGALSTQNIFYQEGPVKGCGECFEVQCLDDGSEFKGRCNSDPNARSVTIMITDACPGCEPDHLDIQALTFNKIAPMQNGKVSIQYRQVQCTPPTGLNVVVDQNAGAGGTLRLTVQQTGNFGSIGLVQVEGQDGGWQNMRNTWGAAWEMSNQPKGPLDLRIQDCNGAEVTALQLISANGQQGTLPTGVQFSFQTTPGALIKPLFGTSDGGISASAFSSSVTAFDGPPGTSNLSPTSSTPKSLAVAPSSPGWQQPPPSQAQSPKSWQPPQIPTPPPSSWQSPPYGASPPPPPPGSGSPSSPPPTQWPNGPSSPPPPPPPSGSSSASSPPPPPPPGSSSSSSTPPPPSSSGCDDTPPNTNGAGSCAQQKQWGQCSQGWMTQTSSSNPRGYCAKTCGRC